jgi:peptidoglycan/LPS O-acetylase OafA/YrhL
MGSYLRRRFVRLVPIALLAIALSVLLKPVDGFGSILANAFFLQNTLPYFGWHLDLLQSNTNLWSLNYEIVYYIFFVVAWYSGWRPMLVALCAALLAAVGFFITAIPAFLTCYAGGALFWFAGLWLSKQPKIDEAHASLEPWISYLLLFIAFWKIKPIFFLLRRLSIPMSDHWVGLMYFDFLPICLVVLAAAARRQVPYWNQLRHACLMVLLAFLAWRLFRGMLFTDPNYLAHECMVIVATLLWFWRHQLRSLESLAWLGSISYALYALQRPAQWLVRDWLPLPQSTALSFALRFAVFVGVNFLLASLGEKIFQPRVADWLKNRLK